MAPPRPSDNKLLEYTFRLAVRGHVALYRLTGGRIGGRSFNVPVLLLTTKGRKTGKPRTIPLLYLKEDGTYVLVASYAGAERHPIWYANLQADPHATIQVMTRVISVAADTADPAMRSKLWPKLVAMYPDYEVYQTRTDRKIPVVLLKPHAEPH
jgi:deazaflavin-dependent oxidoreductase (nitroreductase family)